MGWADSEQKAIFLAFRQKWTHGAGRRRTPKISRPAGQDFGPADMGGGGGGGGGKSEDSLWRRDLSTLGPFGAEANFKSSFIQQKCAPHGFWHSSAVFCSNPLGALFEVA